MDYSKSAVKLCNPPEVEKLIAKWQSEGNDIRILQEQIDKCVPQELKDRMEIATKYHNETYDALKKAVDDYGSYQDLEANQFAVKQRKISKSYDAENFKTHFALYAPAVIIESIDVPKLNGLVKGNLISEEQLKNKNVLTESETFAYIIK